ncbi:Hypothetical protein conserved in the Yarrowia clade [Yarrowia lipolytica]|jgi:hypothetical protein|nr:Hypothetical protein conserved in the Yarrowia clade [Yarrowia lipolytica]
MSFKILQAALVVATLVTTVLAVVQMKADLNSVDIIPADGYIITLSSLSAVYMIVAATVLNCTGAKVACESMLSFAWLTGTILIGVQRGGMSCFSVSEVNNPITHISIKVLSQANCNLGNASITLSALTFAAFCVATYKTFGGNYTIHVVPKPGHQRLPQDESEVYDKC